MEQASQSSPELGSVGAATVTLPEGTARRKHFFLTAGFGALVIIAFLAAIENAEDNIQYINQFLIQQAFGVPILYLSLLPVVESLGVNLGAFPAAIAADTRIKRKYIVFGSLALWGIFVFLMGFAPSFVFILIFRFGLGLGFSGYDPAWQAVASDVTPPRWRPVAIGSIFLVENAAIAFGLPIMAMALASYTWQQSFFIVGGVALVLIPLLFFFFREPQRGRYDIHQPPPLAQTTWSEAWRNGLVAFRKEGRRIVTSRVQMAGVFGRMAQAACFLIINFYSIQVLEGQYHFSNADTLTLVGLAFDLPALIGFLLAGFVDGWLAKEFGSKVHFLLAGVFLVGSAASFAIGLDVAVFPLLIAGSIVSGLLMGASLTPLSNAVADLNDTSRRTFAYAIQTQPAWLISALLVFAIGVLNTVGLDLQVAITAVLFIPGIVGVILFFMRGRLQQEADTFAAEQRALAQAMAPGGQS